MNRTVVFAAVLILVADVLSAQSTMGVPDSGRNLQFTVGAGAPESSSGLVRIAVDFRSGRLENPGRGPESRYGASDDAAMSGPLHLRLSLGADARATGFAWSIDSQQAVSIWKQQPAASDGETSDIDWVGLLSEQVRIDAMMHFKRMTEPKTRREVEQSGFYRGYAEGVKGYFTTGYRWHDGDGFVNNNINHPIMGAVSSHVYTNNDRRCRNVEYGETGYWACIGRATLFSALASVNWEWNPLMSETALGHVGRSYACVNGRCSGEGGWSDFVMTPLGGMGIRIAGDLARAKLWPVLDRHLSGNVAARILKVAVKIATDPGRMANAAFNMNFNGVLSSRTSTGRR